MEKRLTSSDTICTVDENHGHGREEVLGLDRHSFFLEVVEQSIIGGMEDSSSHSGHIGENVTSASCVFTSLCCQCSPQRRLKETYSKPSTELTVGVEQVDVVTSHKVLGKTNDGSSQTLFTVMVGSLFRNVTSQLSDLDLLDDTFLETTKEDLSLTWLETVCARGDGSDVVRHGEEDKLFVDKVGNGDRGDIVVEVCSRLAVSSRTEGINSP